MGEKAQTYTALFVSALALGTSIWSAYETRLHDRLSMQPQLRYFREFRDPDVGLFLVNDGLGPGHVLQTKIYFEGKEVDNWAMVYTNTRPLYKNDSVDFFQRQSDWFLLNGNRQRIYTTQQTNIPDIRAFEKLVYERIYITLLFCV